MRNPKQFQRPNFKQKGKLFLIWCFICDRENHSSLVAVGRCAWCGWHEKQKSKKRLAKKKELTKMLSCVRQSKSLKFLTVKPFNARSLPQLLLERTQASSGGRAFSSLFSRANIKDEAKTLKRAVSSFEPEPFSRTFSLRRDFDDSPKAQSIESTARARLFLISAKADRRKKKKSGFGKIK